MSSRGSLAINGHVTTSEYNTVGVTETGAKILSGQGNNHSLPDYSHTPNSVYVKLDADGKTAQEIRFYDEKGNLYFEIGYHPESAINNGNRKEKIVHFHNINNLNRSSATRMRDNPSVKEKYEKYLKEFGLYDKC